MKSYIDKEQTSSFVNINSINKLNQEEISNEINMEEIMDLFADLFTPKKIIDDYSELEDKKVTNQKNSHSSKRTIIQDDKYSLFPNKDKNYVCDLLKHDMKVYKYILLERREIEGSIRLL